MVPLTPFPPPDTISPPLRLMLREWDKGRQDLLRAVALEPDNASIHQALRTMEFYQGDLDGAMKEYRKAVDLSPRSSSVHSNLGLLYRELGRDRDASAEFRRALELDPNNGEAREGLQHSLETPK